MSKKKTPLVPLTLAHCAAWWNKLKEKPTEEWIKERNHSELDCIYTFTPQLSNVRGAPKPEKITPSTVWKVEVYKDDFDRFIPTGVLETIEYCKGGAQLLNEKYLEEYTEGGPYRGDECEGEEIYHSLLGYLMFAGDDTYDELLGLQVSLIPLNLLAQNVLSETFAWVEKAWADAIMGGQEDVKAEAAAACSEKKPSRKRGKSSETKKKTKKSKSKK